MQATLADGARLEWLPMETIAYSACQAHNQLRFDLAPGAEMIGWDLLALGLPAAGQAFERGRFVQQLELPGAWLERGCIDAADARLLDSPVGWAGRRVLATLWFAAGSALQPARREALLDGARAAVAAHDSLSAQAGATAPHERVVVLRALADRVEPAMQLLKQVWAAWRGAAWELPATRAAAVAHLIAISRRSCRARRAPARACRPAARGCASARPSAWAGSRPARRAAPRLPAESSSARRRR